MTSRRLILLVTLLFIAALTALTVLEMVNNGIDPLGLLSFLILLFFWVGIVGALRTSGGR